MVPIALLGAERRGLQREFAWLVVALAADGLVVVDEQGVIVLANDGAEAMFGYARDQLLGLGTNALVPERFRAADLAFRAAFATSAQPRVMGSTIDIVGSRVDGAEFTLAITIHPVSTERGVFTVLALRASGAGRPRDRSAATDRTTSERTGRVLVVEHATPNAPSVGDALLINGFETVTAGDGATALSALDSAAVDAVILDLDIESVGNLELLRQLRSVSDVPVLIVSGRDEEDDRLLALQLGADDFLTKPFSRGELTERLHAVLRRVRRTVRPAWLTFDDIAIDLGARTVAVGDRPVPLTPLEFDLLVFLAGTPRHVYSRAHLLREVWGSSGEWQTEATVTEHVRRLRRKIEFAPNARRRIITVQRAGYRFDP